MGSKQRLIGVAPLGQAPEIALKIIAAHISAYFNVKTQILPALDLPEKAFDNRRFQYNAGIILNTLESMSLDDFEKVVGVLNQDLFVPIFEYTCGEARQGGKFALVSLYRLGKNHDGLFPSSSLLYERAAKVALHELGHLFNLVHCQAKKCLMHFSGGLDDLDEIPLYLCRYCAAYLKSSLSR